MERFEVKLTNNQYCKLHKDNICENLLIFGSSFEDVKLSFYKTEESDIWNCDILVNDSLVTIIGFIKFMEVKERENNV